MTTKQYTGLLAVICVHPDLTEPGLTEADVQDLSKFIKPKTKVEAVK